jgi:hypothetical protein
MVEQGWVASEVMQDHLENLMSLRFMTVVELVTRHMPEGPTSPMPAGDTSWHAWHRVDPYSMSDLGIELIPTSTSLCSDLRMGGKKYGSFKGMTPMCHSSCSRVATLSPIPSGGTEWLGRTSAGYNIYVRSFNSYCAEGVMGVDLLRTFFSHRVQLLRQLEVTMWMNSGPSYPDRPFSKELGDMEINTWIHRVLAHKAILNLGTGPTPLREGVDNP